MPRCWKCSYVSDKLFNLERHMDRAHSKESVSHAKPKATTKPYECQLCSESVPSRGELVNHFTLVHNVVISARHVVFENQTSFSKWKTEVEKNTASRFVQKEGIRQLKTRKTVRYYCHRDGFFSSVGTGKRQLKTFGSNKINGCCPAQIKATIDDSGSVNVKFVETHLGHDHDLGLVPMKKAKRKKVAAKIADVELRQSSVGDLAIDDHCDDRIHGVIKEEPSETRDDAAMLENEQNIVVNHFQALVKSTRSMDELEVCKKAILSIMPTIEAARSNSVVLIPKRLANTLKNTSPQKNFFSAKNNTIKKETLLQKPTAQEKIILVNSLLLQHTQQSEWDPSSLQLLDYLDEA